MKTTRIIIEHSQILEGLETNTENEPEYKEIKNEHPWDACHMVYNESKMLEGVNLEFVEPDIYNEFDYWNGPSLESLSGKCAVKPAKTDWPTIDEFAWHLKDDYTGLKTARDNVHKNIGKEPDKRVKIAIIDTGYDPNHSTKPEYLNLKDAANFVDKDRPNDPTDPAAGIEESFMKNPGHGTATLAILAGNKIQPQSHTTFNDYLGGAPFAEVVPIRAANSVIHFYSSAIAKAINHAVDIGCDVISISMGGVPTRSWAKAVNRAYNKGITICAAAGNNIAGLPTKRLVFPARFRRVIAVCGATSEKKRYYKKFGYKGMQGNFGPKKVMKTALTAYSPNITWAEIGCPDTVSLDGAGTSSATPQVAAAAALWIQLNMDKFNNNSWEKVEAVRHALFSSAEEKDDKKSFGNGLLKAADALNVPVDLSLKKQKKDHGWFPWIRIFGGLEAVESKQSVTEEMHELEALQLFMASADLQSLFGNKDPFEDELSKGSQELLLMKLIQHPNASDSLRLKLTQLMQK